MDFRIKVGATSAREPDLETIGLPIKRVEVSDPRRTFKTYYPLASMIGAGAITMIYIYLSMVFKGLPLEFVPIILSVMIPMYAIGFLVLQSALGRSTRPFTVHHRGVHLHQFPFDRLVKRQGSIARQDISTIEVLMMPPRGGRQEVLLGHMTFKTTSGKVSSSGERRIEDLREVASWMEREWGIIVTERELRAGGRPGSSSTPLPKARKVPATAPTPGGAQSRTMVLPQMAFCPSCGGGVVQGSRFCPACGHQFGPSVRPTDLVGGKSPRTALLLGFLPGLIGFMGLGHMYVGKKAMGALLLVVGTVLALFALATMVMVLDPAYSANGVGGLVVAAVFNVIFLTALVWSSVDAMDRAKLLQRTAVRP